MVAIGAMALITSPALAAIDNPQSEEWVREWVKAVCAEDGPEDAEKYAGVVVDLGIKSRRRLAQLELSELTEEGTQPEGRALPGCLPSSLTVPWPCWARRGHHRKICA